MTTKLLNFKTFLSKATYQPLGIKPCPQSGQHRHWGRMDCHDIPQKHKKHLKMGIDLHHGMDSTGQIPEGTVPPNAHDFYDDGHHSAKAHGEHTGGGTAGNCNPGTSKKTGKLVPFHRHPGADYCHDINQKHGGSSTNKLIAQQWHNTHQAQLQESWYLFNESQGIAQEEATADPYDAGDDHVEELIDEEADTQEKMDEFFDQVTESFADQVESPGSVDNPHNASVNDIITLKEDYIVDHPAKTYQITDIYEEDDLLGAKLVHTETGDDQVIALSNDNIESIEHWQPEGDPVDSFNPHEFAIGSTFTSAEGSTYEITSVDVANNKIFYNVVDDKGENLSEMEYKLDGFNEWVTNMYKGDENFKVNPPTVPDGFQSLLVGDIITSGNINNLKVGAVVQQIYADGDKGATGTITEIEGKFEEDLYRVDWILESGIGQETTHTSEEIIDSNWQLSASPLDDPDTYDQFYTDDAVKNIPKVGTTIESPEMLAGIPPGTTLVSQNGTALYVTGNNSDSKIIDFTMEGVSAPQKILYSTLLEGIGYPYSVQSLPDVASYVKNKGFVLGGKVTADNFMSLPIGLSFLAVNGNTVTVTNNNASGENPPYLMATIETKDGLVYKDQVISEVSEFGDEAIDKGLKIAGLPDGTVVQHVPEPTGVTPINKHGLDTGTTVTVKNMAGDVSSAKIIKTHKTKAGQNYKLEYTDGPYEGQTSKVSSQQIKDAETDLEGYQGYGGVVVDEPVYKPGQEPTDDVELTLPPLFSEPGNWDEVLEKTGGKLGYNEGGQFKHKQTGEQFYVKFSSSGSDQQVKSEDLANKLYELVGIPTLGTSLIDFEGKTALKSSWNPDLQTININDMSNDSGIMDSFVIDAWLANWDVIGPKHDNTQKSGNEIVKIDSGGALKFGGAGGPKAFTDEVSELESMRDPSTAKVAHTVFSQVSEANLINGAQKLAKVTDAHIDAIVKASQVTNKAKMAATLKARRDDIIQKVLSKDLKQGSDWTESIGKPGQHKHEGVQGWHSESLKHPPSNTAANAAHKELGLPHQIPSLGVTSLPSTKFWAKFNNSNVPAQYKESAQKALSMDWKGTGSSHATRSLLDQFFVDNNITDTFKNAFIQWQGGENLFPRAKVNAAYAVLTSANNTALLKSKKENFGYFVETRGWKGASSSFEQAWQEGTKEAMALIPYISASQQGVKSLTTQANPDTISVLHRGLKGNIATVLKTALGAKASEGVETIFLQGGLQGWSTNKKTSNNFAGPSGVVLSKKKVPTDDVLLYFPTWEDSYSVEEEIGLDPEAFVAFSPNEINVM